MKEFLNYKIKKIYLVLLLLIIMISLIQIKDIVLEKTSSSQTRQINTYIINYVLLPTEELLNFCNFYVKIITYKENILLDSKLESKSK